jgi:hypothetical protein
LAISSLDSTEDGFVAIVQKSLPPSAAVPYNTQRKSKHRMQSRTNLGEPHNRLDFLYINHDTPVVSRYIQVLVHFSSVFPSINIWLAKHTSMYTYT